MQTWAISYHVIILQTWVTTHMQLGHIFFEKNMVSHTSKLFKRGLMLLQYSYKIFSSYVINISKVDTLSWGRSRHIREEWELSKIITLLESCDCLFGSLLKYLDLTFLNKVERFISVFFLHFLEYKFIRIYGRIFEVLGHLNQYFITKHLADHLALTQHRPIYLNGELIFQTFWEVFSNMLKIHWMIGVPDVG